MSEISKIEWCDSTFNPWIGCTKISPACDHCYAEAWSARFGRARWGDHPRERTSEASWRMPRVWQRQADAFEAEHGRPRFVFCASLGDVFDNQVPEEWRADLFDLMRETPRLVWLLLTKRPQNIAKMLPPDWGDGWPHVWLGATVENQDVAERNIPALLSVPAARRFLSCEPLLGPLDMTRVVKRRGSPPADGPPRPSATHAIHCLRGESYDLGYMTLLRNGPRIDWVITGGESGKDARPSHPQWFRSLRDQCEAAGVPFHFKQWGEWLPISNMPEDMTSACYRSNRKARDGEDQATLDEVFGSHAIVANSVIHDDGTLHDLSEPLAFQDGCAAMTVYKVGKKAAGRLLDGVTHDGRPEAIR